MFNDMGYEARLAALAKHLSLEVSAEWRRDVDLRYAHFLVETARNRVGRLVLGVDLAKVAAGLIASHRSAYLAHVAGEVRDASSTLHEAAVLISGAVKVSNPARCEAEMRLYAESTGALAGDLERSDRA
jgi:hypothetical protein